MKELVIIYGKTGSSKERVIATYLTNGYVLASDLNTAKKLVNQNNRKIVHECAAFDASLTRYAQAAGYYVTEIHVTLHKPVTTKIIVEGFPSHVKVKRIGIPVPGEIYYNCSSGMYCECDIEHGCKQPRIIVNQKP